MEELTKEQLDAIKIRETSINDVILGKHIGVKIFSEDQLRDECNMLYSMLYGMMPICDDELDRITKMLLQRHQVKLNLGTLIYSPDGEPWYKEFKESHEHPYFDRYKEYLKKEKGFNQDVADELDSILDNIMDFLGNPETDFSPRRGLVMGDVQSGKTSNYTGLICKAADAGYNAIVILTGTVESLRQQTQRRIDEGFVGFNSDHMSNVDNENYWIGVGTLSNNKKRPATLTNRQNDFVSKIANSVGFSLESFKEPVVFVIKKNVSVLRKLVKWLTDLNGKDGVIDAPLLVIDDEADNASINTKKDDDENPTKINELIRKLLKIFPRNNYVGYTATPFANVFINPDKDDLFPKNFIYSLGSPNTYIGPSQIFLAGAKYSNAVLTNDDCEEVLPLKHKKDDQIDIICPSLKEAIYSYFITNVIRDLRGDTYKHRGMLINISRYTTTQGTIREIIEEYVSMIIGKLGLYSKDRVLSKQNSIINEIKETYLKQFNDCEFSWEQICSKLYDSNKSIECIEVNKSSKMINYDDYKQGARLIVVGGFSLSRGLTIEGLCISYIYRSSVVYDVLLQMGRWFGYRANYDDLFRIWMSEDMKAYYEDITESVEELKDDLRHMQEANLTPNDVGIRIRNDRVGLMITARNKMYTASDYTYQPQFFGDLQDTGFISSDLQVNKYNRSVIEESLSNLCDLGFEFKRNDKGRLMMYDVPKKEIIDIISRFKVDPSNILNFNKDCYINFMSNCSHSSIDKFDIAIIEGVKLKYGNFDEIVLGHDIKKTEKTFSIIKSGSLKMTGSKGFLTNPYNAEYGLTDDEVLAVKQKYADEHDIVDVRDAHPSAKAYFKIKRKPLLLIYYVDLKGPKDSIKEPSERDTLANVKKKFDDNKITPIGIGVGIPIIDEQNSFIRPITYKINTIELRNLLDESTQELLEEELYD